MVGRLKKHQGNLLAPVAGALAPFSFSPFELWPLGIASLFLLLLVLDSASPRQAFWRGWLYGIGFFGVGASWVYFSIHEYGYAPAPLAVFLTALFVASLALLLSAPFACSYQFFFARRQLGALLGFPALWVLFEWLRSWLLTGFPWLFIGNAHIDTWLAGWAPITGVYGLSLIVALTASVFFYGIGHLSHPRRIIPSLVILAILLLWPAGLVLQNITWSKAYADPLLVTLVQPNISQHVKWRPEQQNKTLTLLRNLSEQQLASDLIIWPENAIPLFVHQADNYLRSFNAAGARSRTTFISGIPHWQPASTGSSQQLHNSLIAFGYGADGIYHKQKLVPFGEYIPLQKLLRGLIQFFDLPMSDFRPGPQNQPLLQIKRGNQSIQIAPFICYEIVYPDFVRNLARQSDLLLTVSDDSWFGTSIGPHQHLEMARMRALENSRYLVRGTNTGITAIINEDGQILDQAAQFQQTSLTGKIRLMSGFTPFSRWGSVPLLLLCFILLIVAGTGRTNYKR
ncbi:MAG: apolipoprotein N-acyltransferase [Pseudomonadales bacterium]|nr:apolipoprotein N-acyltransferase [Pseudomonadales bacterium]